MQQFQSTEFPDFTIKALGNAVVPQVAAIPLARNKELAAAA
jgi:hypothetical protein